VAAFTLFASPAFAAEYGSTVSGIKIENCRTQDGKVQMYGKNPFTGQKEWVSMVNAKSCKDLEVSPPTTKKEVKVLGGRPNIQSPEKNIGKMFNYCKDGRVWSILFLPGQVMESSYSEQCVLDSSKTVVLAGL
jgi:hypothetical protein